MLYFFLKNLLFIKFNFNYLITYFLIIVVLIHDLILFLIIIINFFKYLNFNQCLMFNFFINPFIY